MNITTEDQEPHNSFETELKQKEDEIDTKFEMDKLKKKLILSVLFGRLLMMHKNICLTIGSVHSIVIVVTCLHIFTLGTVDSEENSCYLTWPLSHLFYAFINYLLAWFFFYNSCEITNPKGNQMLVVSKKFLKVLFMFTFYPIPLKILTQRFCRNWSLSWNAVMFQMMHLGIETIVMFVYFFWFEKKYTGFKIFYRESIM